MATDIELLVSETRELLKRKCKTESRSSIASEAGINKHWLEKFDQGAITNPTVSNVSKLRAYLLGNTASAGAA